MKTSFELHSGRDSGGHALSELKYVGVLQALAIGITVMVQILHSITILEGIPGPSSKS